jgi:malonyl CoA-acyl carrier protein transacylase
MCAVFNLSEELIQKAVDEINAQNLGVVACANFNCPGQIVMAEKKRQLTRRRKNA